jgi:hypothetical protein
MVIQRDREPDNARFVRYAKHGARVFSRAAQVPHSESLELSSQSSWRAVVPGRPTGPLQDAPDRPP